MVFPMQISPVKVLASVDSVDILPYKFIALQSFARKQSCSFQSLQSLQVKLESRGGQGVRAVAYHIDWVLHIRS